MKKIIRPDTDDFEQIKALTPKQIQLLAKSFEHEISYLKIEIKKLHHALEQIITLRRNLSTRSFEESLPIGIIANNAVGNLHRDLK